MGSRRCNSNNLIHKAHIWTLLNLLPSCNSYRISIKLSIENFLKRGSKSTNSLFHRNSLYNRCTHLTEGRTPRNNMFYMYLDTLRMFYHIIERNPFNKLCIWSSKTNHSQDCNLVSLRRSKRIKLYELHLDPQD